MIEKKITGIMFYYYYVCSRKLWFFDKGIQFEFNDENVQIGKMIDENRYPNEDKYISIDGVINIDYMESENIIHEVKKSKSIEVASIKQVQYYLWYLKNKGINIKKGVINYPLLRKRKEIFLEKKDVNEIENSLKEIEKILNSKEPPQLKEKNICKKCAYYDLCYL